MIEVKTTSSSGGLVAGTYGSGKYSHMAAGLLDIFTNNSSATGLQIRANGGAIVYSISHDSSETFINTASTRNLRITSAGGTTNHTGIFQPTVNNSYALGGSSNRWTEVFATNGTINTSDQRLKTNITPSNLGLDFITRLNPVSYRWIEGSKSIQRGEDGEISIDENGEIITTSVAGVRNHYGLISQEVKSTLDDLDITDFAGWTLADSSDSNSEQGLRYTEFISPMIKAIQEQQELIVALQTQNANLVSRIEALEAT